MGVLFCSDIYVIITVSYTFFLEYNTSYFLLFILS